MGERGTGDPGSRLAKSPAMRPPPMRLMVRYGLLALLLATMSSGAWLLYRCVSTSIEAETNLQFTLFALQLVERFVSQTGRWPHSWGELEGVPMREGPFGRDWPTASPEVQRRILIDFGVDPREVARQEPMSLTAIRPIGPYYEYRDYGGVQSLQSMIRKSPVRGQEVITLAEEPQNRRVYDLAFSPRREPLVCAFALERAVQVWDVSTKPRLIATFTPPRPTNVAQDFWDDVHPLAFSNDGRRLAMGYFFAIQIWDFDRRRILYAVPVWWVPETVRFSAAAGGREGTVIVWQADSATHLATLTHKGGPVYGLAFSPNSRKLVATGE